MTVKARKRKELRSFRLVAVGAAVLGAGFLVWVGLGPGAEATTTLVSNLFQAVAALVAAGACFNAARRNPYGFGRAWTASLHRAWRLLGSAALAWGLGQVVWTIFELRVGEPDVPSLADVGYLTALPLLIAGVLAFPTAPMRATARLRTLLDGLLIAASLLFLGWATVLGDAFSSKAGVTATLERAVLLAYPLGDIVAGTIALVLLTRSRGRGVVHLSMIAAAVFSLLIADLGFAYKNSVDSYATGAVIDAGWVVGWLLLTATALKPTVAELRRSDDEEEPSIMRLALPYAPLVVAAVTGLIIQVVAGRVRALPGLHRHHDRAAGHLPADRRPDREPPAQRPPPGHRGAAVRARAGAQGRPAAGAGRRRPAAGRRRHEGHLPAGRLP